MSRSSGLSLKMSTSRLIGCLALSFALSAMTGAMQSCLADDMGSNLSKLEDKYFQHDFSKEETPERLERLEKLIMGESRTGSNDERLKTLLDLVPNLNAAAAAETPPAQSQPSTAAPPPSRKADRPMTPIADAKEEHEPIQNDSSYPAVTAMEKKLLGRDYIGESVGKRLDRLEIKAYGKTSASDDLQERVDRLKSSTGIDVARMKPPGSEWADEDEDPNGGVQPFTGIAGDDPSAGRNFRKQQALNSFERPRTGSDPYAGTGTYGAGGALPPSNNYSSGTYGSGSGTAYRHPDESMPPSAPDYSASRPGGGSAPAGAPHMGVSQQIALLEKEVFNKTYDRDKQETILTRLTRLETNVFPQDKPATDKSLPQRMGRLLAAVPLSQGMPEPAPQRGKKKDPDFPDLDFPPSSLSQQMPQPAPQRSGGGGLSKIINGLGNALGGGYTTSYPVAPGNLVTDPSTGLLLDQYTGTLIDPMTGAVVSRRGTSNMGGMGGYGYQNYGGFNNGLSPMTPFGGMGSGMNFGFGGGGIRFGGF